MTDEIHLARVDGCTSTAEQSELPRQTAGPLGGLRRTTEKPDGWTSDDWATPIDVVTEFEREFGPFDLDVCCRPETAKAPRYYTKADDGLALPWSGRCWMNPPFSNPSLWLRKAIEETESGRADVVVALLPAATDTRWFHDYVLGKAEVRFRKGRIKFIGWMGTPIGSPKAGTVFAIYRRTLSVERADARGFERRVFEHTGYDDATKGHRTHEKDRSLRSLAPLVRTDVRTRDAVAVLARLDCGAAVSFSNAMSPDDLPDYATERDVRQLEIRSTPEIDDKEEENDDDSTSRTI